MYSWVYFPEFCIVSSSSEGVVRLKLNSAIILEGFFFGVVRIIIILKGNRPQLPASLKRFFRASAGSIRDRVPSGVR